MKTFAIVALKRHDFVEAVIALRRNEDEARRLAGQYMVAVADGFLRCRVQPVDLTVEQIKALCFRWGQEDARSGGPILNALTGVYRDEYRRGYESVGNPAGVVVREVPDSSGANLETTMKTWLDAIDATGFDRWTRTTLIIEAQRTRFPGDLPAGFEFLGSGFADLGFENLGLAAAELDAVRRAFVGIGVRVPGTGYRLRNIRTFYSVVEPAKGSEPAVLPNDWRRGVLVFAQTDDTLR